jgi:Flp pilus assembly pilin Flp
MGWLSNVRRLGKDKRGLSTVEYTVLLVLIVAGAVSIWNKLGQNVIDQLGKSQTSFQKGVKQLKPKGT